MNVRIFFIAALLLICLFPGLASAQTAGAEGSGDIGVSLLPRDDGEPLSYFLYNLAAGGSGEDRLLIQNFSKSAQKIQVYATDGENSPDGGLTGPLFGTASRLVGQWVNLSEREFTLQPNEEKTVAVSFKVPADAAVQDYFGFVFVQPEAPQPTTNKADKGKVAFAIKVQTRYGIALVARVPGPSKEDLLLAPPQKVFKDGKLSLSFTVTNPGNRYLKPKGSWKLLDPAGQVVLSSPTDAWGYLLPGSQLTWNLPLQTSRPLARGKYQLSVEASFGDPLQTRQAQFPLELP